jgi:hypothetical protein
LLHLIDSCGFHGRRAAELEIWCRAVQTWIRGAGEARRAELRALRELLGSARRYGGGSPTARPFNSRAEFLGYISGFVSAEGSFVISRATPRFAVRLRGDERPLLDLLASETSLGKVYDQRAGPPLSPNPASSWVVFATADQVRLIELLTEAGLAGRKRDQMEIWGVAVHERFTSRRRHVRTRKELMLLAEEKLRAAREYRAPDRQTLLALPRRDIREEALAALRACAAQTPGPLACGVYSRWRTNNPGVPARNTIARAFGNWHAAMVAAGLADRVAREPRRTGVTVARQRHRDAQRARVVAAARTFEAEHGRLPRAMEFFKWRFAAAPDTPSQAAVYKLFPGGWQAVLDAARADIVLGDA